MDERRLEMLRELDRRGSVTATAASLHVTPTAVSQQLHLLEREARATLLRRVGRGIELTDAGKELAAASVHLAAAREELQARWDRYRGEVAGTVRLAVFPTAGQRFIPTLLTRLADQPLIELIVSDLDVHSDDYAAYADRFDIVVAHRPVGDPAPVGNSFTVVPLTHERLAVAVAPGHRLADRHRVRPATLAREAWIGVPADWPFDRLLTQWFGGAGLTPRVAQRFEDLRMQEALVAAGHGIALLPRDSVDDRGGRRLRLLDTLDGEPTRQIEAILRPDRAARAVVAEVLGHLRLLTSH
ncbi:LysR family transcriptional regulator [Branchiibius cervicis]|uniref:LysR family transcriptional regulator n=1 Tax=Branchiibius cervicis TaxID=908252 RepID=A0ABW2AXE7_9MICO